MRATISLLGLYNYDNTILDGLTLPSNFTSDELTTLKTNLLMETAEFELLYSNFDFLKYAITQWCEMRKPTWEELRNALALNYNPLENVDMHLEDHTGSKLEKDIVTDFERKLKTAKSGHDDFNQDVKKTGTDSDIKSGKDTDSKSGDDTNLHSVYAYNDNSNGAPENGDKTTYNSKIETQYNSKTEHEYDSNVNTDATTTYANNLDETGTTKNTVDHDEQLKRNYNKDWHGRDHVTAQELIKEQMDIAMFNMIDFIITDFKKRFCLLVY